MYTAYMAEAKTAGLICKLHSSCANAVHEKMKRHSRCCAKYSMCAPSSSERQRQGWSCCSKGGCMEQLGNARLSLSQAVQQSCSILVSTQYTCMYKLVKYMITEGPQVAQKHTVWHT